MKTLTKAAILAAGVALASQGAHAAVTDVWLGFTATGASDYVVDLGALSGFTSGTQVVDLSSTGGLNISTYNSTFASASGPVSVGAVQGANASPRDVLLTQLRSVTSNPASEAGSVNPGSPTGNSIKTAGGAAQSIVTGSSGNTSFSTFALAQTASVASAVGVQNISSVLSTGLEEDVYEAVWSGTSGSTLTYPFKYLGYLTFNIGPSTDVTFTPSSVAVPEPTTYGLLAGVGLLALSLRRKLGAQNA